ncbi:hypothetical protein NUW54_g3237 [Trametes sanguinea]|uniref:Uncharacterized protein n=1 Tax=Trametes sanguinea TaxID=158606 RepID=A0ACC1Q374_9APHY|nr:hypothetical protein NUW54_g3237 [Trametes sanguinea]
MLLVVCTKQPADAPPGVITLLSLTFQLFSSGHVSSTPGGRTRTSQDDRPRGGLRWIKYGEGGATECDAAAAESGGWPRIESAEQASVAKLVDVHERFPRLRQVAGSY